MSVDPDDPEAARRSRQRLNVGLVIAACALGLTTACNELVDTDRFRVRDSAVPPDPDAGSDAGSEIDASTGPVCGDGERDAMEECDDGNSSSGDGCSAACLDEALRCTPGLVGADANSDLGRMVVDSGFLYTVRFDSNPSLMRVIDVSVPTLPSEQGSFALDPGDYPEWRTIGLAKRGDLIWTGGQNPDLMSIDVSDPSTPTRGSIVGPARSDGHLEIVGDALFLAYSVSERARIYDLSVDGDVRLVAQYGNPSLVFTNVGAHGTWAFASTRAGHLEVWDVTVVTSPVFVGEADPPSALSDVRRIVANDTTLALATFDGVHLVDYSVPGTPSYVGTIGSGTSFDDVGMVDSFLYLPTPVGMQVWGHRGSAFSGAGEYLHGGRRLFFRRRRGPSPGVPGHLEWSANPRGPPRALQGSVWQRRPRVSRGVRRRQSRARRRVS